MDIIKYLYGLGAELQGLNSNPDPKVREKGLRYIEERLAEVLDRVQLERNGGQPVGAGR